MEDFQSIYAKAYFNFLKTGSWIEERIKEALKPYNLTHSQLNALYILMEHDPSPVSVNEIKKSILVSNPDVTRLMDRLVKKGYVVRETCPDNRRKVDICLSEEGRKLFYKAHRSGKEAVRNFFEDQISEDEAKELRRLLRKIRS